jgi:hypothetical protein
LVVGTRCSSSASPYPGRCRACGTTSRWLTPRGPGLLR